MKLKLMALVAVTAFLAGCSTQPPVEEDTRVERAAVAMQLIHAQDSQSISDMLADEGWYESVATDLVDLCDNGSGTVDAYRSPIEDQQGIGYVIDAGWAVACPD